MAELTELQLPNNYRIDRNNVWDNNTWDHGRGYVLTTGRQWPHHLDVVHILAEDILKAIEEFSVYQCTETIKMELRARICDILADITRKAGPMYDLLDGQISRLADRILDEIWREDYDTGRERDRGDHRRKFDFVWPGDFGEPIRG